MSDHGHDEHASHGATYFAVFLALCGLTAMSVAADVVHMTPILLGAVVLAVATAKALCVMMFFMHLKFERAWKYLLLAPTIILALALPLSLRPDIGETYYVPDVPQMRDYPEHQARQAQSGGGHH